MSAFVLSLLCVAAVAAVASAFGWAASRAACPPGREFRAERLAWAWAIGAALISGLVPACFLAGVEPGWGAFVLLGVLAAAAGWVLRVPEPAGPPRPFDAERLRPATIACGALVALGVALYLVRALTEPMWSNDYIAIWGLKGKTIHAAGALPRHLYADPAFAYSHPEYPLGLPFFYAGVAFLTGRWDDHSMALVFPIFQVATLFGLFGWLRRHGASRAVAGLAAAILACFEPLYSAFLTGMADVPLSLGLLLFGSALSDAIERDAGALRRLAFAAGLMTATKNEGLFFAAVGCLLALVFGGARRWRCAFASLPTALLVQAAHTLWRGRVPLRDFDFSIFSIDRLGEALGTAVRLPGAVGWAQLLLVGVLVAAGARAPESRWMLGLCAFGIAAYLLFPVFAIRGTEWLVRTSLPRTSSGLAPLLATAVAMRYASAPSASVEQTDP